MAAAICLGGVGCVARDRLIADLDAGDRSGRALRRCRSSPTDPTSAALMTSHGVVNFSVPVALNWNEHLAGSAVTVTGAVASACSSFGLAKWVMPWKIGK